MVEYIKKEDLLDEAYWHGDRYTVQNPYPSGVEAVDVEDIEKMETINIVKCKDCRHYVEQHGLCKGMDQYVCHMKPNDFCSKGEWV